LRPDHHKIHDNENENQRHEKRTDAAPGEGRRRCRLSQNHVQHTRIGERTLSTNAPAAIVLSRDLDYGIGTIEAGKNPALQMVFDERPARD
jgi:hypothetical protein